AGMKPAPQQAQERSAPRRTRRRQGKPVGPGLPRPTAVGHNPNRNPPPPAGIKPAPQKAGGAPRRTRRRQGKPVGPGFTPAHGGGDTTPTGTHLRRPA